MRKLKYVMRAEDSTFVIIPQHMKHSDINGSWTSAGFVVFNENGEGQMEVMCFGKSVSLSLESAKEDAEIIQRAMRDY